MLLEALQSTRTATDIGQLYSLPRWYSITGQASELDVCIDRKYILTKFATTLSSIIQCVKELAKFLEQLAGHICHKICICVQEVFIWLLISASLTGVIGTN